MMGELDLDIVFKQTTSDRIKCKFCSKSVNGENGYIKINLHSWGNGYYGRHTEKRIVVCNACFKEWLDKITIATKNLKESYDKLVKTKILKSLK